MFPVKKRKRWILGLAPAGTVVVDAGAVSAVGKDRKSLLPAGITAVIGDFDANVRRGCACFVIVEWVTIVACPASGGGAVVWSRRHGVRTMHRQLLVRRCTCHVPRRALSAVLTVLPFPDEQDRRQTEQ